MIKDTFTKEEAIELLVAERERAVKIAYEVKEKHDIHFVEKDRAGNKLAFIEKEIADVCRIIGNAISGLNALSITSGKDIENQITQTLNEYCYNEPLNK